MVFTRASPFLKDTMQDILTNADLRSLFFTIIKNKELIFYGS